MSCSEHWCIHFTVELRSDYSLCLHWLILGKGLGGLLVFSENAKGQAAGVLVLQWLSLVAPTLTTFIFNLEVGNVWTVGM